VSAFSFLKLLKVPLAAEVALSKQVVSLLSLYSLALYFFLLEFLFLEIQ